MIQAVNSGDFNTPSMLLDQGIALGSRLQQYFHNQPELKLLFDYDMRIGNQLRSKIRTGRDTKNDFCGLLQSYAPLVAVGSNLLASAPNGVTDAVKDDVNRIVTRTNTAMNLYLEVIYLVRLLAVWKMLFRAN